MISVSLLASATGLPGLERGDGRSKADRAAGGDDQEIDLGVGRDVDEWSAPSGWSDTPPRAGIRRPAASNTAEGSSRDEGHNLEFVGVPAHHVERLLADRAGAAQQGDALHAVNAPR